MEPVVVIDFETTGLSPEHGARATEIAAVLVRNGQVVDRYQSLMNAGQRIPPFIQSLTGITNSMIRAAPPAAQVMAEVADFVGDYPLVAHNASFDRKFWQQNSRASATRRSAPSSARCWSHAGSFRELPTTNSGRGHLRKPSCDRPPPPCAGGCRDGRPPTLFLERRLVEQFRLGAVSYELLQRIQRASRSRSPSVHKDIKRKRGRRD
jgi:DNA polymerase III subunit epsilon